ncbi:ATP-binding protein [Rhodopila sp.]|uniref:ATP-binding protein n=1 Tax=Rhodopila sp. TaxID=2480087 RepID=UPI003D124558
MVLITLSWLNYRGIIAEARHDLERTGEVARENVGKVFDSQSQLVDYVNDLVSNLSEAGIIANEFPLHQVLVRMVSRLPDVVSVMVVARDGKPLVNAGSYPIRRDVDLRDRDYFKALIGGQNGLFVSRLQTGQIYQRPFFGLGRQWTAPDGAIKGIIDVAVSPEFFSNFYRGLLREAGNDLDGKVITLLRDDGEFLARYPRYDGPPLPASAAATFLAAIKKSPDGGTYERNSLIDRTHPLRLFAYRKVRGYPLYVAAGRSWSAIMAEWRRAVLIRLLIGIPITMVLFGLAKTALSRAISEEQALALARQEIARREIAEHTLLRSQRLEAVGQLTGGVAHDFNNLLTVILGNAAMIDRRPDDPARVQRLAAGIQLAAKRGAEITQQLLAFAGRQIVRPQMICLNDRLTAFKLLLDRAASEAVQIVFDLDPALEPVSIDPGQFESAILNLVGNARDAMPNGGMVKIATRNVSGGDRPAPGSASRATSPEVPEPSLRGLGVRVTISDTGSGMDQATMAKAFEPFFTTKDVGKGTGLGLSQVYGFAKQAGGSVRIASVLNKGTKIEITLPVTGRMVFDNDAEPAKPVVPRNARGKVVLVVEDQPSVLDTTVETLHELGFATLAATNGRDALERLRKSDQVDLLFTDIVMPGGINGVQLTNEAKRLRPGLRVVLTSGYSGTAGADPPRNVPLLIKPYSRDQLLRQLQSTFQR